MTNSGNYDRKSNVTGGGWFAKKQGFGGLGTMTRHHKGCHNKRGGGAVSLGA